MAGKVEKKPTYIAMWSTLGGDVYCGEGNSLKESWEYLKTQVSDEAIDFNDVAFFVGHEVKAELQVVEVKEPVQVG